MWGAFIEIKKRDGNSRMSEYKRLKEDFVTGLNGTSVEEIILFFILAQVVQWAAMVATALLHWQNKTTKKRFFLEFVLIVLPILTGVTFTEYTTMIIATCVLFLFISVSVASFPKYRAPPSPAIASLRSLLLLVTAIAILAVDFKIYPRRFAKTENYGTGLMDIGVGGFIVSNGIQTKTVSTLLDIVVRSMPLVLLGLAKLALHKGIDYQEHTSEYGVHWNFFFSLCAVPIIVNVVSRIGPFTPFMFGLYAGLGYQYALSFAGLEDWVMHAPRTTLISQNKEGIASSFGFVSLFFFSQWMGTNSKKILTPKQLGYNVFLTTTLFALVFYFQNYSPLISRRLANFPYAIWVLGHCQLLITLNLSWDFIAKYFNKDIAQTPVLMQALNRNQLFIFIVSNVLTGICNQSLNTLTASTEQSIAILAVYILVITSIAYLLMANHINLSPGTLLKRIY